MSQSTQVATAGQFDETVISSLVLNGDVSKLNPQQKVEYYRQFCERVGLDPLTQPFALLKLNGKEKLYCDRGGCAQLNKLHKVSHDITARETTNGCYVVTALASTPDGRHTTSIGAVPIENLRGEALCNAFMKAETKAKRRATLDLLGLGILDESETDSIPNAVALPAPGSNGNGGNGAPPVSINANPAGNNGNGNNGQPQQLGKFRQKYETIAEIDAVLEDAADVKDIANLYYINAELVESDPTFKAKFTEKKNEFFRHGTASATVSPADINGI